MNLATTELILTETTRDGEPALMLFTRSDRSWQHAIAQLSISPLAANFDLAALHPELIVSGEEGITRLRQLVEQFPFRPDDGVSDPRMGIAFFDEETGVEVSSLLGHNTLLSYGGETVIVGTARLTKRMAQSLDELVFRRQQMNRVSQMTSKSLADLRATA